MTRGEKGLSEILRLPMVAQDSHPSPDVQLQALQLGAEPFAERAQGKKEAGYC